MDHKLDDIVKQLLPYYNLQSVKQIPYITDNRIMNIYVGRKNTSDFYFMFTTNNNIVYNFRISNGHNSLEHKLNNVYYKNCSIVNLEMFHLMNKNISEIISIIEHNLEKYIIL